VSSGWEITSYKKGIYRYRKKILVSAMYAVKRNKISA